MIPAFDHLLDVSKVGNACSPIVAHIGGLDYGLIFLEESVIKQIEHFDPFQRHFHDYLDLHPEFVDAVQRLFGRCLRVTEQSPSQNDASNLPRQSV